MVNQGRFWPKIQTPILFRVVQPVCDELRVLKGITLESGGGLCSLRDGSVRAQSFRKWNDAQTPVAGVEREGHWAMAD